jgi:hypothetical protein
MYLSKPDLVQLHVPRSRIHPEVSEQLGMGLGQPVPASGYLAPNLRVPNRVITSLSARSPFITF